MNRCVVFMYIKALDKDFVHTHTHRCRLLSAIITVMFINQITLVHIRVRANILTSWFACHLLYKHNSWFDFCRLSLNVIICYNQINNHLLALSFVLLIRTIYRSIWTIVIFVIMNVLAKNHSQRLTFGGTLLTRMSRYNNF